MIDIPILMKTKFPSHYVWSPDGSKIAYVVAGLSGSDIMVSSISKGTSTVIVSNIPPPSGVRARAREREERQEIRWSRDGERINFNSKSSYFTVPMEGGEPEILVSGLFLGERVQLSPDEKNISFVRDGDLWVKPVAVGEPRRLTEDADLIVNPVDNLQTEWHKWSPDGTKIGFSSFYRERWKCNLGVVSLEDGDIHWIAPTFDREWCMRWSSDSKKIAFTRLSWDCRRRELLVSTVSGGDVKSIWKDTDERWVSREDFGTSWSHDGNRISFVSNREGWNHLYVSPIDEGEPDKLTEGDYDVIFDRLGPSPRWSLDDSEIAFISNRGALQESRIWIVPSDGGEARKLVDMKGICTNLQWSPDGKHISFIHSGPSQMPGLWVVEASGKSDPVQLFGSLPEGMGQMDLADMDTVKYKSDDGTTIHAVILTPKDLKKGEKYPAIIYMYGWRGQQAVLGWPRIYPYHFLNYLVQKGYVVLIVDPRGSWGYGKEFEIATHLDPGGKHVEDVASGAKYLSTLGYVNPDKIGITGDSGGGYMTVQSLVRFPDSYAAGVERVGVFDLKAYYEEFHQTWVVPRCGMPEQHPHLFRNSNPINHVGKIKAPLLMLAGTEDVNVPFSHAEKMVTALVKAGKEFDFIMYPGEPHRWNKVETWIDSFKRIERFWNKHLKQL